MDYAPLLINVVAIFSGLALYIIVSRSKWGKAHEEFQYAIMLVTILLAVLIGGFLRWLL